ncbi:hypothetical protein GGR54DRAFT_374614 [Hypoxylon sp. NC1633]|nr:hypothetical protein GGR54DRAFT_374614 [Hypoxylon sp. NC1633]
MAGHTRARRTTPLASSVPTLGVYLRVAASQMKWPANMGCRICPPCGHFDGTESATRWLAQLHWQFKRVGYREIDLPPSEVISVINMLCSEEEAKLQDSDPPDKCAPPHMVQQRPCLEKQASSKLKQPWQRARVRFEPTLACYQ